MSNTRTIEDYKSLHDNSILIVRPVLHRGSVEPVLADILVHARQNSPQVDLDRNRQLHALSRVLAVVEWIWRPNNIDIRAFAQRRIPWIAFRHAKLILLLLW